MHKLKEAKKTDETLGNILRTGNDTPDSGEIKDIQMKKRARADTSQTKVQAYFEKPLDESKKNEMNLELLRSAQAH